MDECFREKPPKPLVSREMSLKKSKSVSHDIQSRVSLTRNNIFHGKVVPRLRETIILGERSMSKPEPGPAIPDPRLGPDSIYTKSRSTAPSDRYVNDDHHDDDNDDNDDIDYDDKHCCLGSHTGVGLILAQLGNMSLHNSTH